MKIVLFKTIFFLLCFIDSYSSLSFVRKFNFKCFKNISKDEFEEKSKNLKINEIKNSDNIRNLAYNTQSSSNDTYPLLYTVDKDIVNK